MIDTFSFIGKAGDTYIGKTTVPEISVNTNALQDASITTDKIDDGAVTVEKLANNSIGISKLDSTIAGPGLIIYDPTQFSSSYVGQVAGSLMLNVDELTLTIDPTTEKLAVKANGIGTDNIKDNSVSGSKIVINPTLTGVVGVSGNLTVNGTITAESGSVSNDLAVQNNITSNKVVVGSELTIGTGGGISFPGNPTKQTIPYEGLDVLDNRIPSAWITWQWDGTSTRSPRETPYQRITHAIQYTPYIQLPSTNIATGLNNVRWSDLAYQGSGGVIGTLQIMNHFGIQLFRQIQSGMFEIIFKTDTFTSADYIMVGTAELWEDDSIDPATVVAPSVHFRDRNPNPSTITYDEDFTTTGGSDPDRTSIYSGRTTTKVHVVTQGLVNPAYVSLMFFGL